MKKLVLGFLLLLLLGENGFSQRGQSVYAELLGNGLLFSFNYDTRFTNSPKGIGGRGGLGYIGGNDEGVVLIPFQVNYLLGKNGKYFELGIGATAALGTGELFDEDFGNVVGTLTFGFRKQPEDGGFMWKIGITPIIAEGVFWPYFGGISLGYAF